MTTKIESSNGMDIIGPYEASPEDRILNYRSGYLTETEWHRAIGWGKIPDKHNADYIHEEGDAPQPCIYTYVGFVPTGF